MNTCTHTATYVQVCTHVGGPPAGCAVYTDPVVRMCTCVRVQVCTEVGIEYPQGYVHTYTPTDIHILNVRTPTYSMYCM